MRYGNKIYSTHKLVAMAFHGLPMDHNPNVLVDHIDGDRWNNFANNLRISTY